VASLVRRVDIMASNQNPRSKEGNTKIAPSRSKSFKCRSATKAYNTEKQDGGGNLKTNIFQSIAELVCAKGYKVIPNPPVGIDLIASKPTELPGHGCVLDVLPFKLHQEPSLVKISDNDNGSFKVLKGESDSINVLSNELVQNARSLISTVTEGNGSAEKSGDYHVLDTLFEGLETCSVNLLVGKLSYTRFKGEDVKFWVNPILLTACKLENESGESKPWIPIPARLGGLDVDVVGITNLASYLDLREKEVRVLGREALKGERGLADFPRQFKTFRILTLGAALTLIAAFLVLASNTATGFPTAQSGLGLALMIEAYGGWRLVKSYQHVQRNNNTKVCLGSQKIAPEQVVMYEGEFAPDELQFLYSKYGGAELSRLRKELRTQRIDGLVRKAEDLLNKAEKLESEKLYSEAILCIERATRSTLNATLLSVGVEAQARDVDQWIPSLKNILQKEKLEDLRYLKELRDKVNSGYDASHHEVEMVKERAKPIIESAVDHLRKSFKGGYSQDKLSTVELLLNELRRGSQTKTNHYRERSRDHHKAQQSEETELRVSNEFLDTTQSSKFLLNIADDKELLNLRAAGGYLVKAKKTLESDTGDHSKRTELLDTDSAKISEELDDLTQSLTSQSVGSRVVPGDRSDSSDSFSDEVAAPRKVLPFEHLADFRKVITRCQLPVVASFLSDDKPSKEVETAMESLVAKHRTRAAFIAVGSKSEDIARECKIKSYPTILVFHDGKSLGELKLTNVEQLEKDLLKVVGSATSGDREEAHYHKIQLTGSEGQKITAVKRIGEQSEGKS